jgi:hypothetical protein
MANERTVDRKLRLAVIGNKFNETTSLVKHYKANPNLKNGELFMLAASMGQVRMVLWLGELGGDLPKYIRACQAELKARGHKSAAELLLKHIHKLELEEKL